MILSIDFETRATVDLRKAGIYPYAKHHHTAPWCMAWAFDAEEPQIWTPGQQLPERVHTHVTERHGEVRAFNANFERLIWQHIMVPRFDWPTVQDNQWVDTAAEAAAMGLPRSLDQLAIVLGLAQRKDAEGYALMMRMTKPRAFDADGEPIWWDTAKDAPGRLSRLYSYCAQDVRVERAAQGAVRRLSAYEREIYLLDQRINDKGVEIDLPLVRAATVVADEGIARADAVLCEITDSEVTGTTKVGQLRQWTEAITGKPVPSLNKAAIAELMESDLDPRVRTALQMRSDAGRSSIAKLDSMQIVAPDGRARGLALYHAAHTGRWGGKLIQPQNFPRGEVGAIESFIPDVLAEAYDVIDLITHPVIVVSSMLRSMMRAAAGHDLMAADFAAVECRIVNWLAGQEDVLEHFRKYDAGDGAHNPYKIMAVRMGRAQSVEEVLKPSDSYQAGKAAELGCGFGMGAEKFVTAAWDVYQLRVTAEEAEAAVEIYRSTHAQVKAFWYASEAACMEAIRNPGQVQVFGGRANLRAVMAGAYLYILLPSGRPIAYAAPRIVMAETPWSAKERLRASERIKLGIPEPGDEEMIPQVRAQIEYSGVNSKTKQWCRMRTYGGHLVENIVQAVARDLLADAMLRLDALGHTPVLHSHDEVVIEVDKLDDITVELLCAEVARQPAWALDCPIAAEGWRGERYRK